MTAAKPTGAVASTPFTQPAPPNGTSATVYGSVHAGQDAQIRAVDLLGMVSVAGVAAVGLGAIGAGVGVVNLGLTTDAGIASTGRVSAGGTVGVHATLTETFFGLAAAGALGGLAISGQVMVLTDTSSQKAHIDDGAAVPRAGTLLDVDATSTKTVAAQTFGVSIAVGAAGAAVTVAKVSGDTIASIGNVAIGEEGAIGGIDVAAADTFTPTYRAYSIQGGILGALSGAVAAVWYTGTTRAESGAHGTVVVGATGVKVTATGTRPAVNIDSLNITTGGIAVGVTVARAMLQRNTEAATLAVGSVATSGAVSVSASSTNGTVVSTPGGAVGGIAIALMFPYAEISGHTRVQVDGERHRLGLRVDGGSGLRTPRRPPRSSLRVSLPRPAPAVPTPRPSSPRAPT